MSLHSDTISWFRANKSLLLLPNATCSVEKLQILEPGIYHSQDEHANNYTRAWDLPQSRWARQHLHQSLGSNTVETSMPKITPEPGIYHSRDEHANNYTRAWDLPQSRRARQQLHQSLGSTTVKTSTPTITPLMLFIYYKAVLLFWRIFGVITNITCLGGVFAINTPLETIISWWVFFVICPSQTIIYLFKNKQLIKENIPHKN
jgi:hypothetical protein